MRKLLLVLVLALGGIFASTATVSANGPCDPWAASAAFPTATPPGWYTNTYSYAWYYPWYAYYNYSQGPYANWMAGRGYASYGNQKQPPASLSLPSQVTISLPVDAKLSFSGIAAAGTGAIRTFTTPPLEPNQEYGYEMTVEVVKNGRTLSVSKVVIVRAGENVQAKFDLAELKEIVPPPVKK